MDDDRNRVLGTPFVTRAARWGIVAWTAIGILLLAYFAFQYVVYPIRIIFPPLVVAMILVYLLNPIVSAMERRGIGRIWGSLLTYLVGAGIVGAALTFIIPLVTEQVQSFARTAPALISQVTQWVQDVAGRLGIDVTPPAGEGRTLVGFLGRLLSITRGLFDLAIVFILGPILAFYLLVDLPKIRRALKAMIPVRRRTEVESVLRRIGRAVGGFFRGQLLVALVVGIASAIGLYIVGLPFWAVVGLVAGLFNLIPLIGPWIAGVVAVVVAFTTNTPGEGLLRLQPGLPLALGSAIALLIIQQIDGHILSPNIVARTVRLHPVTVLLGLLAGGTLLGLWGMLLAVPVLATIKILLLHAWDTQLRWPPPGTAERVAAAESERAPPAEPAPASAAEPEAPPGPGAPAPPPSTEPAPPGAGPESSGSPAAAERSGPGRWSGAVRALFGGRRRTTEQGDPGSEPRPAPERASPGP